MFIGRKNELNFFNEAYSSDKAEFITLYGRRRVGKTEFLSEFCKDKPCIFYTCREYTNKKQFAEFSNTVLDYSKDLKSKRKLFSDWNDLFSSLPDVISNEKLVLVIDEFPYMVKGDKSIPSILQVLWDEKLRYSNLMIILCGSSISFMEDELLAAKNPLYGRMTGIYKMLPLPFSDVIQFFPDYSDEDKLTVYSILGGIPHYLKQFNNQLSLEENVKHFILTKGTVLFNETEYILHQELREPAFYVTIIQSIAAGNTKFNEICENTQIESGKLSVYLKNLVELGILTKEYPVLSTAKDFTKKNLGEYKIFDNFFRFWFFYAYPYLSELSLNAQEEIWEDVIAPDLHRFSSKAFENVCIDYLIAIRLKKQTPFRFRHIGRWWGNITHKEENKKPYTSAEEIDIVATDMAQSQYILGECKFTNAPFDMGQFKNLVNKNIFAEDPFYYLFSLNGFTDALINECNVNPKLTLITLADIIQTLQ